MTPREWYPPAANVGEDKGAESRARQRPCSRSAWCTRTHHAIDEACVVVSRYEIPRSDFGPRAATNTRRGKS